MSVTVSADDIKRVKGLGFLQQKGTDTFNARVLTRNGKITTKEAMMVAEAADKYGNGEMAFTTRQTIEVQGIHYDNIPAFTAAIEAGGLLVGGTGPKVRPIVSCKGTTCQYGLYDTYGLSEKIHERFYIGYHGVKLPHKFKIATGGCPNNCVKPDLNDVGIIGQKVPKFDADKCSHNTNSPHAYNIKDKRQLRLADSHHKSFYNDGISVKRLRHCHHAKNGCSQSNDLRTF